jgi:Zn-dependent protease with chaperone function
VSIFDLSGSTRVLVAAAIAFVPAVIAYVRGRQMARFIDDPALPERLFAGQQVTSSSLVVSLAALIMLTGRAAIWAIPLTIVAYFAAGLPLRRILYQETWSLAVYLSFVIRFFVAFWSFWLLVGALPALALWGGERAWITALVIGAGLFFLGEWQAEVIRWLIRAEPIGDAATRARFDRLVAASGIATPHFEVVNLKGGCVANAFALASLTRSAVIFSGTLLERFDADEVDAICAHELAHLEHYNPRRLRQRRLISRSLIVVGAVLTPLMQQLMPSLVWIATAAWPVVVVLVIAFLVQDRQKHETASDLRAVALTGHPEALVRALGKLHAIARVPRRWDADLERHMSHPSLKRRIQDIRGAAGTPPAALGDTAAFESMDGAVRVVFRDAGIEWIEGASSFRLAYERLGELRIVATRTGETSLMAADRTLRRWQMPLRLDDVPRIQAVLDIVDMRVQTSTPDTAIQPMLIRATAFVVLIVSLNAGLFAVAMILGMTLMRPEAPLMAAAGLAAVAGAVLTWRDPGSAYLITNGLATTFAAVLLVSGALLIVLAYLRRRDEVPPPVWKLVGFLAAAAAASWALPLLGTSGIDAVGVHQAARGWPSSVVLPLALAGAMIWSSRKTLRLVSATGVVASAIAAGAGSQAFLDRFGGDMFLVPATDVAVRTLDRPVKEFTVPFAIGELHLSPGGRSIAAVARRYDNRARIHIGRAGEVLTELDADGALFIDDDRALVWTVDGSRTDLREVVVGAPEAASWRLQVTGVSTPTVSLDPVSRRWRLSSPAGASVVEAREGAIGTEEISTYRWNVPEGHGAAFMPVAISGERALVVEPRPDLSSPITNPLGAFMFVFASSPYWRSTIWSIGPDGASDLGTSRLELECRLLARADRGVCRIFDASRTRFFAMDAATGRITAIGSLPGRFYVGEDAIGPWINGWYQSELVAVRLDPADAIRVVGPDDSRPHTLALSERAAAGVWYQMPATASLRIDPISAGMGTSLIRIYPIN